MAIAQLIQAALHEMGRLAHAFAPASDEELTITGANRLGGQDHGFEAGATDFVDACRSHTGGQPAIDGTLSGDVLAQAGRHYVAHDHLVDLCQVLYLRSVDGGTDRRGPEFSGG